MKTSWTCTVHEGRDFQSFDLQTDGELRSQYIHQSTPSDNHVRHNVMSWAVLYHFWRCTSSLTDINTWTCYCEVMFAVNKTEVRHLDFHWFKSVSINFLENEGSRVPEGRAPG